jgi:hypothetical protein
MGGAGAAGPGPALERLASLEGDWMGEERLAPSPWDPDGGSARGRYRFGTAIDGRYLLGDDQQDRGAGVNFRGHAVLGWDAATARYAMWWFDSAGAVPTGPSTGGWVGSTLTLELAGPAGSSRYAFTVEDERLQVRIDHAADGSTWATFLEGTYSRA